MRNQVQLQAKKAITISRVSTLEQAADYLNPQGILVMEVGNSDEALQARFPTLAFVWLEQWHGGHGLFVLTREQLVEYFHGR